MLFCLCVHLESIIGVQMRLTSFSDLTQSGNIEAVLQKVSYWSILFYEIEIKCILIRAGTIHRCIANRETIQHRFWYFDSIVSSFKFYLSHTRLYRECITSSEMWVIYIAIPLESIMSHLLLNSRLRIDSWELAMHSENVRIDPESMYLPALILISLSIFVSDKTRACQSWTK